MERRRVKGDILAAIRFVLSPLSWWNDLVVNLPLAYAFGVTVSLVSKSRFLPSVVAGYWLTNVIRFVLLHKDAVNTVSAEVHPYTARRFIRDLAISVGCTVLVVLLVRFGFLSVPDGLLATLGRWLRSGRSGRRSPCENSSEPTQWWVRVGR